MDYEEYERSLDDPTRVCLRKVCKAMNEADKVHSAYRPRWTEAYNLHRNHELLENYARVERDRDLVRSEFTKAFGPHLFIPLVFSAIETIVPRILAANPTMTVKPNDESAVEETKAIKELLEQQQLNIDYDLKLQPTVRRGLKYGLGVQKTYWDTRKRDVMKVSPRKILPGAKVDKDTLTVFDGPQVEDVDVFDFFWDPAARSVETARWMVHRTWRDLDYISRKIKLGHWFGLGEPGGEFEPVDERMRTALLEAIGKTSGTPHSASDATFDDRMSILGFTAEQTRAGRVHEVLEYHDREWVYTIINRKFVAVRDTSPFFHRELPFQIFRPTMQEGEFVGISEIEPIKHLQYEINTIRSQRRTNALYILDRVFAYADGMIEPKDLQRGPGAHIPTVGDPREVIFPIPVEDLPASSYRETEEIKGDFDRTTGVDDSVIGAESGDTATGTQLIQQAANIRIAGKTKNLMAECVRPAARQFFELNRQFLTPRKVRIDDPNEPEGYRFATVDQKTLFANVEIQPDAGSTEPENTVQKRNDALTLFNQLNGNPAVEQRSLVRHLLEQHEVGDVDSLLAPETQDAATVLQAVAQGLRGIEGPDGQPAIPDDRIEAFIEQVLQQVAPPEAGQAEQNGAGQQPASEPPVPA